MSSPRHVLQFRGRVVLSASESISCRGWRVGGGGWRVAGGLVWPVPRSQSGDGSAECHLAAGRCCLAAWPAMVTKLVPDNIHPSYQLMGSAVTVQIISGQKQCSRLHTVET